MFSSLYQINTHSMQNFIKYDTVHCFLYIPVTVFISIEYYWLMNIIKYSKTIWIKSRRIFHFYRITGLLWCLRAFLWCYQQKVLAPEGEVFMISYGFCGLQIRKRNAMTFVFEGKERKLLKNFQQTINVIFKYECWSLYTARSLVIAEIHSACTIACKLDLIYCMLCLFN